jgi:hypothetical protein
LFDAGVHYKMVSGNDWFPPFALQDKRVEKISSNWSHKICTLKVIMADDEDLARNNIGRQGSSRK